MPLSKLILDSRFPRTDTQLVSDRYEIKQAPIGQGGMGVVYNAYDKVTKRHVALKTMRGIANPAAIDLFEREWTVLARLSHPNIVDILDTGEFVQGGQRRPYFVMPLLPGVTLDHLINSGSQRLTVERTIAIIGQACRGLQAAHDQGLIHRDLKPSNIFVLDDDAVKIIDFGVVHLSDTQSIAGMKGTLQYMAPEQLDMKPATLLSDIFSIAVVCYEALTARKPFVRETEIDIVEAIRSYIPPPAFEINPAVSQLLSRTVHKGMAKQPWHRFSSAREFAETLQKAVRNEPVEIFERIKLQPRIDRVKKAHGEGDYQFAMEILTELESEGHIDPEMSLLRIQIEQSVRQKTIRQLLEGARTRMEEDEHPLALQKIQEVLNIDPTNVHAANLRSQIERQRSERQIEKWYRLVRQHLDDQLYGQARQGIQEILKINSTDFRALELLAKCDRAEREAAKVREEKQKLYQSALDSYKKGEISTALSKLERLLDPNLSAPKSATPEADARYQSFYNQIRSERDLARNAYAEGRKHVENRNFVRTLEICEEFLHKRPDDPMFQALKIQVEEIQRQEQSAAITEVNRRIEAEPNLDKKYNIIRDAVEKYPAEPHFKQSLKLIRDRRELINSIVSRARQYEERGQFNDAAGQWAILRSISPLYPGLDFEVQRSERRRQEQAQEEAKARWVEKVDRHSAAGEYSKAREIIKEALLEFPEDQELQGLDWAVEQAIKRNVEAETLLQEGQHFVARQKFTEGLNALRNAERLDERNPAIRAALMSALLEQARVLVTHDWHSAESLVQQALELESGDPTARSLSSLIADYKRQELVGRLVLEARALQAGGNLSEAVNKVEQGLVAYPNEIRLSQLHGTLRTALKEIQRNELRSGPAIRKTAVPQEPTPPVSEPSQKASSLPTSRSASVVPAEPVPSNSTSSDVPPATEPTGQPVSPGIKPPLKPPEAEAAGASTPRPTNQQQTAANSPWSFFAPSISKFDAASSRIASPPVDAPTAPVKPPTMTAQPAPGQRESKKQASIVWVVLAVLLIPAALLVTKINHRSAVEKEKPLALSVAVVLSANMPNAKFTVDDRPASSSSLKLRTGQHRAEAMLDGYLTDSRVFTIPAGSQHEVKVVFDLRPAPPQLRIDSDLKTGKFVFDDNEPLDLQDGNIARTGIAAGDHTVKILDSNRQVFSFAFHVQPGELVSLTSQASSNGAPVLVVSSLGTSAKLYASPGMKAGIADQPLESIPIEGLTLSGIPQNKAHFVIDDGRGQRRDIGIDSCSAPVLHVLLNAASNVIPLTITANVPDGIVVINGKAFKRPMVNGTRVVRLPPGKYKIQVTHANYEDSPERQMEIKAGDVNLQALDFSLVAISRTTNFAVQSAPPDAEILVDGIHEGNVDSAGKFTKEFSPGNHSIVLRKQGFEDLTAAWEFKAGEAVRISGDEMKAYGTLMFKVLPPDARITYRREDESQTHAYRNDESVSVRAGNYEIGAEADKFTPRSQMISVASGKTILVDLALEPIPKPVVTAKKPSNVFENGSSWTVGQDGWWRHTGTGSSFLRASEGIFVIDILKQSRKGMFKSKTIKIEFVADYKSANDRVAYSLDEHNLRRKMYSGGAAEDEVKVPHGMESGALYRLTIEITPERIVIKNRSGKLLDSVRRNVSPGKFGFEGDIDLSIH